MTINHRIDNFLPSQQLGGLNQQPQPVAEGTFTHACVNAVKRIPRSNVLRHLCDEDWHRAKVIFPFFCHHFSIKNGLAPNYGVHDLLFFVLRGKHTKSQIPALSSALGRYANNLVDSPSYPPSMFRSAKVYFGLAFLLPPSATLYFRGEHRDDKYFAQLGVEKVLTVPVQNDFYDNLIRSDKEWFYGLLALWVNTIEPEREYFEILGALVARETLTKWLDEAKAEKFTGPDWKQGDITLLRSKAEQIKKYGIANVGQIDELMKGRVGNRDNSAHNNSVIASNEDVLLRMSSKLRSPLRPSFSSVRKQILDLSRSRKNLNQINDGLAHLEGLSRFVDESNNQLSKSSAYVLRTLWAYANSHKNRKVAENLRDAILLQLAIIGREKPCIFGCVGHLLGTLQGIDPAFSVSDNSLAVKERLRDIAIRVQKHMDKQLEDTELEELEERGVLDESVLAEIKLGVFRKSVDIELRCFDGVLPAFYQREAEELEAGFRV